MTLTFYTNPMSRGRIARWMLEEIGHPYETVVLDYATTMKAPAYLAINPMGKVPAIRHGEVVITECAAICAYLADAFPDAGLAPAPGIQRDSGTREDRGDLTQQRILRQGRHLRFGSLALRLMRRACGTWKAVRWQVISFMARFTRPATTCNQRSGRARPYSHGGRA